MFKDMYIEGSNVVPVVKALSSDIRLKILHLLSEDDMNVQAIAKQLNLSKTAILAHVNLLEEAGFIKSKYLPGSVGNQRICRKIYNRLIFNFDPVQTDLDNSTYYQTEIPVGNFFDFDVWAPCGLATHYNIIDKWDDPRSFCSAERTKAMFVWTAFGYFEYKIPIDALFLGKKISAIKIELEISSHQMVKDHKALNIPPYTTKECITDGLSDVTFFINNVDIGLKEISAGLDQSQATYTPTWWRSTPVHGEKIKITINNEGCFINSKKTSDLSYDELVKDSNFIKFRVQVKEEAKNQSGIMIFGKEFGKYYNDIVIKSYIE